MQTPVDAFYGTLQNIANLESTEAANKLNQIKLAAIVDAEKQKKADLATIAQSYQAANQPSFVAPQPTGLMDIAKGSIDEDFNASMGLGKEPPKQEAQKKSYAQVLLSDADKQRQIGESLRKAGSPNAQAYFDAADKILEKAAPLMKEERQAEAARIKEYGNRLAFVTDQATLDAALSGADSQAVDQVFGNKLPRGLDGRILATPNVIKLANDIGKMSIDAAKRMEIENTTRDIVNKEANTKRQADANNETERHNRAVEANAREGNRIREKAVNANFSVDDDGNVVPVAGGKEENKRAERIRADQAKALKPVDEIQQKVTKAKALLQESTPASDVQLQMALTDVFDKTRATNMLFQNNKNFGSVAGRVSGLVGRAFTGQYTDEQRRQIAEMLNTMESTVLAPSRQKITDHYSSLAEKSGVRKDLVNAPDFYGANTPSAAPTAKPSNAVAEADAFLKGLGKAQ